MKRNIIRTILFDIAFYLLITVECVLLLPTLLLPRRFYMNTVRFFVRSVYFLERTLLGLKFEVRGAEHVPTDGAFILAAKHQSAYETMKLHILFRDPAVILKKELLSIPLWGQYLKRSDPIAIDRSSREAATQSIKDGALRMKAQGRPILIFPQGTRVAVDVDAKSKPYKIGVARMQEDTDLPIVPMAMNSGMFWPRNGWLKSSGTVVFEFLPPIAAGMERGALMEKLERDVEGASEVLMREALERNKRKGIKGFVAFVAVVLLGLAAYTALWYIVAQRIGSEYKIALGELVDPEREVATPEVTGFPGKIKIDVPFERLQTDQGFVEISNVHATGWPLPFLPIDVQTGEIVIRDSQWGQSLQFESLNASLSVWGQKMLRIHDSALVNGAFIAGLNGDIDLRQEPIPALDMNITLINHSDFIQTLVTAGIVDGRMAMFINAGLGSFMDADGMVSLPLVQKDNTLFAGPLAIYNLPAKQSSLRRVRPDVGGG